MSNDTRSRPMTAETIHTCSYECERPECVRRQRDELRDRMEADLAPLQADFEEWAASIGFCVTGKYAETIDVLCAKSAFKAGYQAGRAALAQQPAGVTEEMVERAGRVLYGTDWGSFERWEADQLKRKVRAVLTAALAAQQQGGRADGFADNRQEGE